MHAKDLLTFEKTLCMWTRNFILLWCSSILLLPPLDEIDEICTILSSTFWGGCRRLGFIFSQSDLPYLLLWSWVDLGFYRPRLALSPLDGKFGFFIHFFVRVALSLDGFLWTSLSHHLVWLDLILDLKLLMDLDKSPFHGTYLSILFSLTLLSWCRLLKLSMSQCLVLFLAWGVDDVAS